MSKGQLYWRWPGATTHNSQGLFICFDVYERPVAAHLDAYPPGPVANFARQDTPKYFTQNDKPAPHEVEKDGRRSERVMMRFAVFADMSEELLAEMLMGFIVLCAQNKRRDTIPAD